ncbi:MAG: VWA domain-containing protein [Acidimicrobiia bacterium]|nr:VWA domain-containing protein [Acidimicrobiia bacterium]NNF09745.1 VWA domain-containing protein [Acidimicrobiia bacterium]NNL71423.1 VWA domain-containing protein [Acidimicrobiia bacterium]
MRHNQIRPEPIRSRAAREDEGAMLVLFAVLLVVVMGVAALAVDSTMLSQGRQQLWNTADAAALAGASQLPDDGLAAESLATKFALDNEPGLAGSVDVTFRCLVSDADANGQPDPLDVGAACDPGPDVGMSAPPWVCEDGRCAAPCVPADGDTCNTIVLATEKQVDYAFGPVIGQNSGDTGIVSAACRGTCGSPATGPVDLIMIIDRTTSMSDADLANAKAAALAVLDYFDPGLQHVGLAAIHAGDLNSKCDRKDVTSGGSWLLVGLSNDYKDTPTVDINGDAMLDLDGTSPLVNTIQCLNKATGTNLGSPIKDDWYGQPDAYTELMSNGRPGVKKGIILLSDGSAHQPGNNPCQHALHMANAAKSAGIEIFTIGFGIGSKDCNDDSGPYTSAGVAELLADMATGPTSDNCAAGTENSDGDHFFCEPPASDLSQVFLAAAAQFAAGSQLVSLPTGS